ncbi:MAG: hypothetical protein LBH08_00415 [Puniceicoccales bacterium]|jgi:hypothetical protein|nr:hypothetical protein [Puniceicoccales bacterium]
MKTNTKIRLLVAALGGSIFSYSDVRATGHFACRGIMTMNGQNVPLSGLNGIPHTQPQQPRGASANHDYSPHDWGLTREVASRDWGSIQNQSLAAVGAPRRMDLMQTSPSRGIRASASHDLGLTLNSTEVSSSQGIRASASQDLGSILSQGLSLVGALSDQDCGSILLQEEDGIRWHQISSEQQERGLAEIIFILLGRNMFAALPEFTKLLMAGIKKMLREGCVNEGSFQEFFMLALRNPQTFEYVTHTGRSAREALAMYTFVADAVTEQDGIINLVKCNVMNDIIMIIQHLIVPDIPEEVIMRLENFIDQQMDEITPILIQTMFTVLQSDGVAEIATGCCGWCKKLKPEDKQNLAKGICHTLGVVLGRFLGTGIESAADELANGICGLIAARSES